VQLGSLGQPSAGGSPLARLASILGKLAVNGASTALFPMSTLYYDDFGEAGSEEKAFQSPRARFRSMLLPNDESDACRQI
jgi:hypothetical protein